jgi:hypothetical protein
MLRPVINKAMLAVLAVILTASLVAPRAHAAPDKKNQPQGRLLYGKVLDERDNPIPNAVVYLTDSTTHAVKTYIISDDGKYRFPGLGNADYEVYAQYGRRKSETRSLSQFDDRSEVYIDLRIALH